MKHDCFIRTYNDTKTENLCYICYESNVYLKRYDLSWFKTNFTNSEDLKKVAKFNDDIVVKVFIYEH